MLGVPLLKNRRICNLKRYYIHKSLLSPSCLEELEVEDMLPSVMDGDGIVSFCMQLRKPVSPRFSCESTGRIQFKPKRKPELNMQNKVLISSL